MADTDEEVARFTAFRDALKTRFGIAGDRAELLAFEMTKSHPLAPGELTQALVDTFLAEETKRFRERRNRIDTAQLGEADRRRKLAYDEELDAEIRKLTRSDN